MKRYILILFLSNMLIFGCIGLSKKKCDSSACMKTALYNNCEEAIYEGSIFGVNTKSEIINTGSECKVIESIGSKSVTCVYTMPVTATSQPKCS